jgi:RNA polymerase sigma-70 factor (ECF subfamily)
MMIMAIGDMTATGTMENWSVTGETGITTIGVAGTGTGTMTAGATIPRPAFAILGQRDARHQPPGWQPLLAGLFPGAAMSSEDAALAAALIDIRKANPGTALAVQNYEQNNESLEKFFANHEEKAFYVAYAALWNRETAMDVVQESMLRLIEYYRDKPSGQWPALFRTILNSRINDVRRRRMLEQGKHKLISLTGLFHKEQDERHAMDEYEIPSEQRTDGITAPEVAAVSTQLRHKIEEALQALSERQRQVFILREWRGMTIEETSRTLGCSENSVKQHHFRAMRELRKQLAEVWDHA